MKAVIIIFLILCSTNTSEKLYTEGNKHFEAKEYADAMYSFVMLLKENPDFSKSDEVKFKIAQCFELQDLSKQASIWYEKIIKENKDSEYVKDAEAKIKELKSAIEEQEQLESSKENTNQTQYIVTSSNKQTAEQIQEAAPTNELIDDPEAEKMYQRGKELIEEAKGKRSIGNDPLQPYRQGISILKNVIMQYRNSTWAIESQNLLASCYVEIGDKLFEEQDYQKSEKIYQKVTQEFHKSNIIDYTQYKLARSNELQRKFKEAINEFRKLITRYPKSEWADNSYERIGAIYSWLNEVEKAKEEFKKLLKEYPYGDMANVVQHYLGTIYFYAKDYKQALIEFNRLLENYPDSKYVPWAKEYINQIHEIGIK